MKAQGMTEAQIVPELPGLAAEAGRAPVIATS